MPDTHDLSQRRWGRNYEVLRVLDGDRIDAAIWATPRPKAGDYLILCCDEATTRYQVEEVKTCGNPRDMAIVKAVFAPRNQESAQ